ncbi:MAG TPA: aminotransferase class III-fold pyridoxal phosphate-dependent enzyme [Anaerolineae bacterium]|nr:aminotransferase class III-fold pyridoxal phosphate-dependent enzyme [Anaerolineae bacterium]
MTLDTVIKWVYGVYGLEIKEGKRLPGIEDENWRLTAVTGEKYVLKIAGEATPIADWQQQNKVLHYLAAKGEIWPRVLVSLAGEDLVRGEDGRWCRLLTYIEGQMLADVQAANLSLWRGLGRCMGRTDALLANFEIDEGVARPLCWNLAATAECWDRLQYIPQEEDRALVHYFLQLWRDDIEPAIDSLRHSLIHCDVTDYNVIVDIGSHSEQGEVLQNVVGLIDFGDMRRTATVFEVAIGLTYALMDRWEPFEIGGALIRGYHEEMPLMAEEIELLYGLVGARLCINVTVAAEARAVYGRDDEVESEERSWVLLRRWRALSKKKITAHWGAVCGYAGDAGEPLTGEEILTRRRSLLGRSLSLSYERPLHIVKGSGAYLYDAEGRRYLDGVNNVCHVGHGAKRVVAAANEQMAVLNTNTRYLHENIVRYAEALTGTLPEPLSVCFFVNSGSEANDLALRLARNYTGREEILVLDGAYHGHLSSLIEISPYKFKGKGGRGRPEHVRVLSMPDGYRGRYKWGEGDLGAKYGGEVAEVLATGWRPAAFIGESLLGCGGQIVLPDGYLATVYEQVREVGGVCIADEVQVGFGRVGSHFWGFETQGVVPDIVTMGKPIGNGYPLAAVVTTAEIAEAFANGMEYFNTYGGNPVACAVGLAVLAEIEAAGLQARAERVGRYLKAGLRELAKRYQIIGDVRGLGLFLGVELVQNRAELTPAPEEAHLLVNRLRERGILLSTDGPWHNVLKIKPPLVWGEEEAEMLLTELAVVLAEIETTV